MISDEEARRFAAGWIKAWNAHDLNAIVGHYAAGVEFFSPYVVQLTGDPSGRVQGGEALGAYFAMGLTAYPGVHFELLSGHFLKYDDG